MWSPSRRLGRALAAGLLLVGAAAPGSAQAPKQVSIEVTIVYVSEGGPGIADDERARKLDGILGKQFRYQSLSILDSKQRQLPMNEVWSVDLPTGKRFVVRPIDVDEQGVLVAVDLEEKAQGDFRVRKQKPLILGGESFRDGKLVIVLEPDY